MTIAAALGTEETLDLGKAPISFAEGGGLFASSGYLTREA
ncbi:hypothetical protein AHiyo6_02680 [Arthrobacter sp. Hiyo6]|jgi:hypothetical protein|nr:hypothetical protein AHiyo6_02680 [Arthrobacter sp. Hiyo6]